jgi:hypothetical protein
VLNRPEIKAMLGTDKLSQSQMTYSKVVKHLEEGVYNGHNGLGFNHLVTSHRHISNILNNKDGSPRLAIPVGIGVIGNCATHASGGRGNLAARYSAFRGDNEASDNADYDENYDEEAFADFGGTTLLIPIFTWHVHKSIDRESRRPRFNLVCSGCFEHALSARDSYMRKIEVMSMPIPRRLIDGKANKERHKVDKVSRGQTTSKSPNFVQEATRLTAPRLARIIEAYPDIKGLDQFLKTGLTTKKHKNKGRVTQQKIKTLSLNGTSEMVTMSVEYLLAAAGHSSWQQCLKDAGKVKTDEEEE